MALAAKQVVETRHGDLRHELEEVMTRHKT